MAPKAADQTKSAGKDAAKTTPLLQLPDLPATNGTHAAAAHQDDSGFDQDAADPLQAALGLLINDEDDGDDLQEFESLRTMLATVIKTKQDKTQKKKQALLQELQEAAAKEVQAFEASVAKDHKQFASTVTNSMTATKKKLVEKFQVIEDLSAKYQQDLKTAWDDYTTVYNKFDETKRTVAAQLDKLRSSHKRKLSELQTSLQGKLTEADQKLTKLNSKAGKAQGLGGMLKQFMAAAE